MFREPYTRSVSRRIYIFLWLIDDKDIIAYETLNLDIEDAGL